jgi:hypothetical protein
MLAGAFVDFAVRANEVFACGRFEHALEAPPAPACVVLLVVVDSHERGACEIALESIGAVDVSLRMANGDALRMRNQGDSASTAARRTRSSRSATSPAHLAGGEGEFVHRRLRQGAPAAPKCRIAASAA